MVGGASADEPQTIVTSDQATAKIQQAWDVSWNKFFLPQTNLFYDFLESYEPGKELAHLPNPDEVKRLYPNEMGYGTGMEDCMIFAGAWLAALVDKFDATGDETIRQNADQVLKGIELCATAHGSPGFLARGVCPTDGKSSYINSSRDQYTHAVHGLWLLYHSPLSTEEQKARIRTVARAIADRMMRNVTAENDFDSLCADGSRCRRGIQKMWNVYGHEAGRLPMIYAVAWDTLKDADAAAAQKYYDEYRKYMPEAVKQSLALEASTIKRLVPMYAMLQMQCSLDILYRLETDPALKRGLLVCMSRCRDHAAGKLAGILDRGLKLDLAALPDKDWREEKGGISDWNGYRKVWYNPREMGEAILTILMHPFTQLTEDQRQTFYRLVDKIDYQRVSTSGIFYLIGAYWRDRVVSKDGFVSDDLVSQTLPNPPRSYYIWPNLAPGEKENRPNVERPQTDEVPRIFDLTQPSIFVYHANPETATGQCLLLLPGGGYAICGYGKGHEIGPYLAERGVTVVTLKYRVPRRGGQPKHLAAFQDAQRAISFIRSRAAQWNVNPENIGVSGFSAGGHLTVMCATNGATRCYEPIDVVDQFPCHVNFAIPVYAAYLLKDGADGGNPNRGNNAMIDGRFADDCIVGDFAFDEKTPPMCFIHGDVDVYSSMGAAAVYHKLRTMGIPAELHFYAKIPHAFKSFPDQNNIATWVDRAWEWMKRLE